MNRTAEDYINENPYLHLQPMLLKAEIANIMEAFAAEKQLTCLQNAARNAKPEEVHAGGVLVACKVKTETITNPDNLV